MQAAIEPRLEWLPARRDKSGLAELRKSGARERRPRRAQEREAVPGAWRKNNKLRPVRSLRRARRRSGFTGNNEGNESEYKAPIGDSSFHRLWPLTHGNYQTRGADPLPEPKKSLSGRGRDSLASD
jgi:hypothetical protein